jgi:hypothetical protein
MLLLMMTCSVMIVVSPSLSLLLMISALSVRVKETSSSEEHSENIVRVEIILTELL